MTGVQHAPLLVNLRALPKDRLLGEMLRLTRLRKSLPQRMDFLWRAIPLSAVYGIALPKEP